MLIERRGCTRIVIIINRWAIKIPNFTYSINHFLKGWVANIHEIDTWKAVTCKGSNEKIKYLLCPVISSYLWGFIIVMPKVIIVEDDGFIPHKELLKICGDHKPDNYGWYKGRLVCIDYGQ